MKKLVVATLGVAMLAAQVMLAADQGKSTAAPAKPAKEAVAPTTTPAPSTAPGAQSEPMAKKGKKHHHKKNAAEQPK
ncbi:MAG: hypothetical protein N2663_01895 [Chlorobi bacterium]|nr:hypothetical protein [Chlorobiota bacterium]